MNSYKLVMFFFLFFYSKSKLFFAIIMNNSLIIIVLRNCYKLNYDLDGNNDVFEINCKFKMTQKLF